VNQHMVGFPTIIKKLMEGSYLTSTGHVDSPMHFEKLVKSVKERVEELKGLPDKEVEDRVLAAISWAEENICKPHRTWSYSTKEGGYYIKVTLHSCSHPEIDTFYMLTSEKGDTLLGHHFFSFELTKKYRSALDSFREEKKGYEVADKFEKWCGERGGDFERGILHASCTLKNPISLRDVNSFLTLIDKNRDELRARGYELCIEHYEKLSPTIEKTRFVCYSPADRIAAYTHYFGEPSEELLKLVDAEKFKHNLRLRLVVSISPEKKWSFATQDSEISYTEAKQNPERLHTMLKIAHILP